MKIYWELFSVFMRIGAFTFGGGYAMLPLIQKEIVDKKHWATEEEIMDYYAVAQCTPIRIPSHPPSPMQNSSSVRAFMLLPAALVR